jgi:hypothetical protein
MCRISVGIALEISRVSVGIRGISLGNVWDIMSIKNMYVGNKTYSMMEIPGIDAGNTWNMQEICWQSVLRIRMTNHQHRHAYSILFCERLTLSKAAYLEALNPRHVGCLAQQK